MANLSNILKRLLIRLSGVLVAGFALLFLLALFSFNSSDPSFNTSSSNEEIRNWVGSFGSHLADLSFQIIGISSFFLCLIIFILGTKIASKEEEKNIIFKIILTPFSILCFASFFACFPAPSWWQFISLGGVNGHFILAKLHFIPLIITAVFSLFLALVSLSIIIELKLSDWIYSIRYFIVTTRFVTSKILQILLGEDYANKQKKVKKIEEKKEEEKEEKQVEKEESKEELKTQLKAASKPVKRKSTGSYQLPSIDLLVDRSAENKNKKITKEALRKQGDALLTVLKDFGVKGNSLGAKVGPVVTLHEFEPAAGTKAARVIGLSDDIARSMSAISARIAVISGKTSLGIEMPNEKRQMIFLRELMECKEYRLSQKFLPMILGKDIGGEIMVADLAKMPHLLIAGTTGSGKSVGLNVMILSLLFSMRPDECKFIMIDPKMLELSIYDGIPHLLAPVVTEPSKAVTSLKWVVAEMEERYRLMSSFSVRNIAGYNEKAEKARLNGEKLKRKTQTGYDPTTGQPIIEETEFEPKKLPFIVVIVDEMADLMLVAGKEVESLIQRLAQMARAAGIHIIMATQRPSVDVITGVIKANFPTRISFQVTSRIDSRTILGVQGAEQLLGQGDMMYMSGGGKITRVHGPFCSDKEIEDIVNFIKSQSLEEFEEEEKISFDVPIPSDGSANAASGDVAGAGGDADDIYNKAIMIIRRDKKVSISYIQRQLRIGYNKAADLVERMEKEGIVTPPSVSGKREIIEE